MKGFLNEFKTFAIKGNAIDLAVGVVVGAAFGQITTSLAKDIITPPIGFLLGGFDFSTLAIFLGGDSVIRYGSFLQAILNFVIIAFALFLVVRALNRLTKKQEQDAKAVTKVDPQLEVLKEIRDSLTANK